MLDGAIAPSKNIEKKRTSREGERPVRLRVGALLGAGAPGSLGSIRCGMCQTERASLTDEHPNPRIDFIFLERYLVGNPAASPTKCRRPAAISVWKNPRL